MIQVIKLLSGEEIIGDTTINDKITIKDPCALQMMPSRSNPEQVTMAFVPLAMHLEDRSITVKEEHVLWINKPVKDLYNQYNSAFGSGLVLPT